MHLIRGLTGLAIIYLLFSAIQLAPMGEVAAIIASRPIFASLLALSAALTMAVLSIILKSLARTEKPDAIVIWQMVVFIPCSMVPALFVWVTPSLEQLALLVGVGLFGTATQRCLTRAYAAADAFVVVPFDFSRLIFAAVIGFLLFNEFPDIWTWVGGTIICLAILWMVKGESKETQNA